MKASDLIGGGGGLQLSVSGNYDKAKFAEGFSADLQALIAANTGGTLTNINSALTGTDHYIHQMVIDTTNNILYIYGGLDSANAESDTLYKYDITTSTLTVLTTALTGTTRYNHRMVIDLSNQKLIIYGGRTGIVSLDDLIIYDIALATTSTTANFTGTVREGSGMAFDETNKKLYIYGGSSGSAMFDDLLVYDFLATTPAITTLSSAFTGTARYYTKMVFDTKNSKLIVYGGYGTVALDDMYSFDTINLTISALSSSLTGTATNRHTMSIDNTLSTINIYNGDIDTIYSYDIATNTISTINTALSGGVRQHSQIVTGNNSLSYIYGGYDGTSGFDVLSSFTVDTSLNNAKLIIPRIA